MKIIGSGNTLLAEQWQVGVVVAFDPAEVIEFSDENTEKILAAFSAAFSALRSIATLGVASAAEPIGRNQLAPAEETRRHRERIAVRDAVYYGTPLPSSVEEAVVEPVRRRRRDPDPTSTPAEPTPTEGSVPTGRRDRRSIAPEQEKESAKSPSEITDVDLSKAASAGAASFTPAGVKAILEEFKAKNVHELKGKDRRSFLSRIQRKMEEQA